MHRKSLFSSLFLASVLAPALLDPQPGGLFIHPDGDQGTGGGGGSGAGATGAGGGAAAGGQAAGAAGAAGAGAGASGVPPASSLRPIDQPAGAGGAAGGQNAAAGASGGTGAGGQAQGSAPGQSAVIQLGQEDLSKLLDQAAQRGAQAAMAAFQQQSGAAGAGAGAGTGAGGAAGAGQSQAGAAGASGGAAAGGPPAGAGGAAGGQNAAAAQPDLNQQAMLRELADLKKRGDEQAAEVQRLRDQEAAAQKAARTAEQKQKILDVMTSADIGLSPVPAGKAYTELKNAGMLQEDPNTKKIFLVMPDADGQPQPYKLEDGLKQWLGQPDGGMIYRNPVPAGSGASNSSAGNLPGSGSGGGGGMVGDRRALAAAQAIEEDNKRGGGSQRR